MKAVFRVDASGQIGTGHVVRCRTLAEALRRRGAQVSFVCRAHPGHMIDDLASAGFPVTILPAPRNTSGAKDDYAAWLGVTQSQDADETIAALDGERSDWLIMDHYGLSAEWQKKLRPHAGKILVIDDVANRPHDCDVLLDQNHAGAGGETRYRDLVPRVAAQLLGPSYAVFKPEYRLFRETRPSRDGSVRRVLIYFGGVDGANVSALSLEALSVPEFRDLDVDIVIGPNNPHRAGLEKQATQRPRTHIHGTRPHLADLMASADLAIGAGGTTSWERLCMGLPTLVVALSENQIPASEAMAGDNLIRFAGKAGEVSAADIRRHLSEMIADRASLAAQSGRGMALVDGQGAERVAELMMPTPLKDAWLDPLDGKSFALKAGSLDLARIDIEPGKDSDCVHLTGGKEETGRLLRLALAHLRSSAPRVLGDKKVSAVRYLEGKDTKAANGHRITILSDASSWLNDYLPDLVLGWISDGHRVAWAHDAGELSGGDFCFYLSCGQIVPKEIRSKFTRNLVVHESALPEGRGWSPLTWQVLEGRREITVTLFEAADSVDSGDIYLQDTIRLDGGELVGELRDKQAAMTFALCRRMVTEQSAVVAGARPQSGKGSTYKKRGPADSALDPSRPLDEQIDLLRVADPDRYPAFFEARGNWYKLRIEKTFPPKPGKPK